MKPNTELQLTNLFREVFIELSASDESIIKNAHRDALASWDSIGQMTFISLFEETFSVHLPEDIAYQIDSYQHALNFLSTRLE